jgi:ABC-2 type transport system ATP-binding protein
LALAHRPELVILDDPALGLDPIMRKQFNRDLIAHLQGEGRTVFYSSHLLYEVEPVADEIAILHQGRIVRHSDTETLRRHVKQFIVARDALATVRGQLHILDERADGEQIAITVQGAEHARTILGIEGAEFRIVDLNLDEIFEAYVVGRRVEVPPAAVQPPALVPSL